MNCFKTALAANSKGVKKNATEQQRPRTNHYDSMSILYHLIVIGYCFDSDNEKLCNNSIVKCKFDGKKY